MVGPVDGISRVPTRGEPRVAEQFTGDAGVAHRPAVTWLELRRAVAVLDVAPPGSLVVAGRAACQVGNKHAGEVAPVTMFDLAIACESQHASGAAAATTIIPEAGHFAAWKSRGEHGVPTALLEAHPRRVTGELPQQAEYLGVTSRAVAPAVAVTLDALVLLLGVGVRHEKALRARFVPGYHVGDTARCGGVGPAGRDGSPM